MEQTRTGRAYSLLRNVSRTASTFAFLPSQSTLYPLAQNSHFSAFPRTKFLYNSSILVGIARCSNIQALPCRYSLLRPHVHFPTLHTKHLGSQRSLMLNSFKTAKYWFGMLTALKRELSRVDICVSALTVNLFTLLIENPIRWLSLTPGSPKTARYQLASLAT